jgi:hypothetical protein
MTTGVHSFLAKDNKSNNIMHMRPSLSVRVSPRILDPYWTHRRKAGWSIWTRKDAAKSQGFKPRNPNSP